MIAIPIRISIREDAAEDVTSIETTAAHYARQLLADLDLPAEPTVSVDVAAPGSSGAQLRIGNGNEAHRLDDRRSIAAEVTRTLYERRRELVSDEVAGGWAARAWPDAPPDAATNALVRELLLGCADRNISLRRTSGALPSTPAELEPWPTLCRLHTDDRVAIHVASAADAGAFDWAAMQAEVYQQTGWICPLPVTERPPDAMPGEYQVRINDVHFAVQTWDDDAAAIVESVRDRVVTTQLAFVTCDAVSRRLELAESDAPLLASHVRERVGIETLCARVARQIEQRSPIVDFDALLDSLIVETMRYAAT